MTAPTRVAIQGERGAFSHEAALNLVPDDPVVVGCRTFEGLFQAISDGSADLGIVPVENTLAGSVQHNLDLLIEHSLHVVAETRVRIGLCLVVPPGRRLEDIRTAASHPVALNQCRGFFRAHPDIDAVDVYDTAGSVKDLLEGRAAYDAAIGSALAAELYGGEILAVAIEDHPMNYTRFLAAAREAVDAPERGAKTSLTFTVRHRPGSLRDALSCFASAGVDLTRIESRPIPGKPWHYRFYADVRGVTLTEQRACIEALRGITADVRVLGSYEESVPTE